MGTEIYPYYDTSLMGVNTMEAKVFVDTTVSIGVLDKRIYGQFIEHLGRCIYGGIWVGEKSKIPNIKGFRKDVLEAIKEIRPPIVRWPGGNFASAYHWEDGIGPREQRPRRYDLAWGAEEPNEFGTDEFIEWCRLIGAEPFIVVNAGNGTPEEAARWVEYCNSTKNTYYAQLRRKYGHPEPYNVKLWGIGNELYGRWQVGFCINGEECARRTVEFANEMKKVDPNIELVGVGCEDPEWDLDMIRLAGEYIDDLSIHIYVDGRKPYDELVAMPMDIERRLKGIYYLINAARKKWRIKKEIKIAFDEWNVYTHQEIRDAVFTALTLNTLQRLCNEVAIACYAQTVNVLPLIVTRDDGAMFVTPQYLVFKLYVQNTGKEVIMTNNITPYYYSKDLGKNVPIVDSSATMDKGVVYVYMVNRSKDEAINCTIEIKGITPIATEHLYIAGEHVNDKNSFDEPNKVRIQESRDVKVKGSEIRLRLSPHSVNLVKVLAKSP